MNSKPIIYQMLPRLWGNDNENLTHNGNLNENGTGKFSDIDAATLDYLAWLGCSHVWYTGVIEHATKASFEEYGIRRYGAHGTSHRYVSGEMIKLMGGEAEGTKIVTCHVGNGSSISAVMGGKVVDTSMGFTPLEGVEMGTRCGSIDPAIVPLLMKKENLTPDQIDTIMNKKSGILGVSQVTSDNRDIEQGAKAGNERYQLIESMICHQLTKYIGGYAAAMGGVDAVVFTAGVGENSKGQRMEIASGLEFMGVKMCEKANDIRGEEAVISAADSKVKVLLIPTNEELMIAMDTMNIVK